MQSEILISSKTLTRRGRHARTAVTGVFGLTILLITLVASAADLSPETILVFGVSCADNSHEEFDRKGSAHCVCDIGFKEGLNGQCNPIDEPATLAGWVDEICKIFGCDENPNIPDPDPNPCAKKNEEGLNCLDQAQRCRKLSREKIVNCETDLDTWSGVQCEDWRFPPGVKPNPITGQCLFLFQDIEEILKKPMPQGSCMDFCKGAWKEEGRSVTVTFPALIVGFEVNDAAPKPGVARFSSCNDASVAVLMTCQEEVRNNGCPNQCFKERSSGMRRSLRPATARERILLGNPYRAQAFLAQRESVREYGINKLAYRLLNKGKTSDALELFRWNAENFPNSANVYDSLGEAHWKLGSIVDAVRNYEAALSIDPTMDSARRALQQLRKKYPVQK